MPFLSNIGTPELFLIVVVLVAVFGGSKMHEWAKGIGQAGKDARLVKKEIEDGFDGDVNEAEIMNEDELTEKTETKKKSSKRKEVA